MTEKFVRDWLATYSRGDLEACLACYADDAVFEDPLFGERADGKHDIEKAFSAFFFSGVTKLRFLEWDGGAEGGAVQWEWTADWGPDCTFLGFDASNKTFTVRGVTVLKLRDRKIVRQTDYWDARNALRQLGALDR